MDDNFKKMMKALKDSKEQKNKKSSDKNPNDINFIKYSDVIKEKIKENKKEESLLRNFDEIRTLSSRMCL